MELASDKLAADIVLLDLRGIPAFTDFFVIMTAEANRQIEAIAEDMAKSLKQMGLPMHHREGQPDSGWVLLDFGGLVVHIFGEAQRELYDLERIWERAVPLLRVQ